MKNLFKDWRFKIIAYLRKPLPRWVFLIFTMVVILFCWLYSPYLSSYEAFNLLTSLLDNIVSWTNPSWQQAALAIVFILVYKFKRDISALIDRIKEVGRDGVKFHEEQKPVESTSPIPENTRIDSESSEKKRQKLLTIQHHIQSLNQYFIGKNISACEEKNEELSYYVADLYFMLRCERIYAQIYGGQITILKKLAQGFEVQKATINDFIEKNKKDGHKWFDSWDVNKYMEFLIQSLLVEVKADQYCITNFGRDFLTWMKSTGMTEMRFF